MEGTKNKKIATILFIMIMAFFITLGLYQNTEDAALLTDSAETNGKIIEFDYCNYAYCADYVYYVNGKRFVGYFRSDYFKCPDGTDGCIGHEFPVEYSLKDPSVSEIYLGKYEPKKHKKPSL